MTDPGFDAGQLIKDAITKVSGYVAAIVPAGLLLWGSVYAVGYGKKAAKKAVN